MTIHGLVLGAVPGQVSTRPVVVELFSVDQHFARCSVVEFVYLFLGITHVSPFLTTQLGRFDDTHSIKVV